ncbi:peptide deformylase [Shewanella sp. Scap07]|uniref:peptide deformylase n=1 Tax=Shewanella sp. Scap07 TaxID=2589987 RepID=UPI00211883D9|nr:peptide deformylase [Shewanella sp. Scap07]
MLSIIQHGDPKLLQPAKPVVHFDSSLQQLSNEMMALMLSHSGVGIAAPQVGQPVAMFIVASQPNPRYPEAPMMQPTVMCNPSFKAIEPQRQWGEEGCLSLGKQRISIARYTKIAVRFQTLTGQWQQQIMDDFIARIFQHEHDHLQGITLVERQRIQMELAQ